VSTNTISAETHIEVARRLGSVVCGPVGKGIGSLSMHGNGHGHRGKGKPHSTGRKV